MIWQKSTYIGCSKVGCPQVNWWMVCNYGEEGNSNSERLYEESREALL